MKKRVLIVDDERLARTELRRLLAPFPEMEIVDEACNGEEALAKTAEHAPDLLFLDVQMPGRTGFDVLAELERPPAVIFTTAYDQFALRAFEVNALDYLLKPIEPERLAVAIARLDPKNQSTGNVEPGRDELGILENNDRILVKDGNRCWFVALGEVSLFESEGNYVRLFFGRDRPLVHRSLAYLEARLSPRSFFRAGRKYLVNLAHIKHLEPTPSGGMFVHVGGETVEMSRRQAQKFRETMSL